MRALKKLPITYTGTLHDVRLICFSVPKEEVLPKLPNGIIPIIENGRIMFSLVSVNLTGMQANVMPIPFNYHHVALRMCVADAEHNDSGEDQGVYFYQSYTDNYLMVTGGRILTNYNLEQSQIRISDPEYSVKSDQDFLRFAIDISSPKIGSTELYDRVRSLDRAYFVSGKHLYRTRITRSDWPVKWADCYAFETNIFQDVLVEGAFYIDRPIDYKWNKPECIE